MKANILSLIAIIILIMVIIKIARERDKAITNTRNAMAYINRQKQVLDMCASNNITISKAYIAAYYWTLEYEATNRTNP